MGSAMAERLLKAGFSVSVYNRTKKKADPLLVQGAHWCESAAAAAASTDVVFSMLSTPEVLTSVALSTDGILSGLPKNGIHIDCSTVSPDATGFLEKEYIKHGCRFLHAPVLGSTAQVADGSLLFFAGGDEAAFHLVENILQTLGKKIWYFPSLEQATTMKLICNSMIAGLIASLVQALVLGKKAGIDPRTFLEVMSFSQLNAPTLQLKGAAIIERNFSPRFFVEHLLKDIVLVADTAASLGVPVPVIEEIRKLFIEAKNSGWGKEDYSAVVKVLEQKAGIEVR
jgi:3-hydroxyisobutyrate dehydrogenase-like beta-hydroxyacid dehydrogenase